MDRRIGFSAVLFCAGAAFGCAPPPKVLVGHNFSGQDKSVKMMMQDSGIVNKANDKKLFNVFVRMCDVTTDAEAACKDTQVLDSVNPGSVY